MARSEAMTWECHTLAERDLALFSQGRHERIHELLGAHLTARAGVAGVAFAVWAPAARHVSVVGDFNGWHDGADPMAARGASGVWEAFIPGAAPGQRYMFAVQPGDRDGRSDRVHAHGGEPQLKADPYARAAEVPPGTASVITGPWPRASAAEREWRERRRRGGQLDGPLSIYEVHLGSWRWAAGSGQGPSHPLSYVELARELPAYVRELGFTHVELLPVMAHPFVGSWGYQVTGYYAPNPALGPPDDLRALVRALHEHGLGVILDWVPAHFARDGWALARFDGGPLYEHPDPERGRHAEWGTLVFDLGRPQVRNFLIANALYWLREFHADGLRVDAVSSMLYADHARPSGAWAADRAGVDADPHGVEFLRELTETIHRCEPGALCLAEEATAWPGVTRRPTRTDRPASSGRPGPTPPPGTGLGFDLKWNMGWAHDTLAHLRRDPADRAARRNELTFSLVYAFDERFVLPLSHDDMAPPLGSLYAQLPGTHAQKLAGIRTLYAYAWAHPGKKLLFMGGELAQPAVWSVDAALSWELLANPDHAGVQALVRDLNRIYREHPALWAHDFDPSGFRWLDACDSAASPLAFLRLAPACGDCVAMIANLSPRAQRAYRVGLPAPGPWNELINTDHARYAGPLGSDATAPFGVTGAPIPWQGQPFSAELTLAPLSALWLAPATPRNAAKMAAASGD